MANTTFSEVYEGQIIECTLPSGEECLAAVYNRQKKLRHGKLVFDIVYVSGSSRGLRDILRQSALDPVAVFSCTCVEGLE